MHGGDIYNNSVDIDFSVNMNPYDTPELLKVKEEAAREGIAASGVYPDIDQTAVRKALAKAENIDKECVFAGCGASELIMASVRAVSPARALLVAPGFGGYEYALKTARDCRIDHYTLSEENGFILTEAFISAICADIDMLFLADPANPTGQNIDEDLLEKILDRAAEHQIVVVLDQSFFMLSDKYLKCTHEYVADLIVRYKNLYIIRSYTKCFSLPGIRMGYVMSRPENISGLRSHLPEWNLPSVSSAYMRRLSGYAADSVFYKRSIEFINRERRFLADGLSKLGFEVFPGNTNFLMVKNQKDIYEKLLSEKILIRRCDDFYGLDERYFRIAVRSHKDNARLIDILS